MKTLFKLLITSIVLCTFLITCTQKNYNGSTNSESDIKSFVEGKTPTDLVNNSYYRIIEFPATPSADDQAVLRSPGIQILEYIPDNSYLVAITTDFQKELLLKTAAETIKRLPPSIKTDNRIKSWAIPAHAQVGSKAKVAVIAMKGLKARDYESDIRALGLTVDNYGGDAKFAYLTLSEAEVQKVAQLPWVRYIEIIDEKGDPEGDGPE